MKTLATPLLRVVPLVALALTLPGLALAKQSPARTPIVIDGPAVEATVMRGTMQVGVESGVPRALYALNYPVVPGQPETMARQFLSENLGLLKLGDPQLSDLSLRTTRQGRALTVVRFEQTVQGVPVLAPDIAVTIDKSNRVTYVMNGYVPGLSVPTTVPAVSDAAARGTAREWLQVSGELGFESARLVVVPEGKQARLAWRVEMIPRETPVGDWEVLVDATSGQVFRSVDRALYVNGTGFVYDPDPLGTGHATYGSPGYTDAGDVTTAQLDATRSSRTLLDITDIGGGTMKLQGPYAVIVDSESPFKGLFTQPSTTFNFDRAADAFEAVNTYFHVDQIMRHMNVTLGIPVMPFQYAGGVRFDPSGLSGADNSHYTPGTGQIAFGEGGVDDAEDADVIIHELGHGLHDWVTGGQLSQVNGLSEGTGDYIAQSYSRSLGQWTSVEAPYHWTFSWDGHNEFWPGRITNYGATYPGGLVGQVHSDGQIWATCLMRIWNDVGRNKTDAAVFEGLSSTNGATNQNDAAQAVLQAAIAFGYTNSEINAFVTHMQATGYTVSVGIDYLTNGLTDECSGNAAQENGIVEPGEEAEIAVTLKAATVPHTGVSGILTSATPGVTILDNSATWPDLSPGVPTPSNAPHFRISLDGSAACYSVINFQVSVTSNEGGPYLINFTRPVGQLPAPTGLPLAIPDNSVTGVNHVFPVAANLVLTDVNVRVKIDHTYVGDLYIKLRSPLGTEVVLLDRPGVPASTFGCANDNMDVTFDDAAVLVPESYCPGSNPWLNGPAKPFQVLSAFNGQSTQGDWMLTVRDLAGQDLGNLVTWELLSTPAIPGICEECDNVTGVPNGRAGELDAGVAQPNPFSRATQIAFQLPRAGRATLRVYDVAGHVVATLVDGELPAGPHTVPWDGKDASGTQVAAGVYFYRLSSGIEHGTRRMLLVR